MQQAPSGLATCVLLSNHFPARGRKHPYPPIFHCVFSIFQTTSPQGDGNGSWGMDVDCPRTSFKPLPRKGTETESRSVLGCAPPHFQTTSPQGDGNTLVRGMGSGGGCGILSNHFPARGRKHNPERLNERTLKTFKPLPRKGTETVCNPWAYSWRARLSNHFPARGRKQGESIYSISVANTQGFQTTSPQGDGNFILSGKKARANTLSNHFPARGRKLC